MHRYTSFIKDWKNQSKYFRWLLEYSKPYLPRITLMMLMDLANTLMAVYMAILSKQIIDSATNGGIVKNVLVLYVIILFGTIAITSFSSVFSIMVNEKFSFGIRKQLYEKIIHSRWMEVERYHTGDMMTRMTSDAGAIANGIVSTIPNIIRLFVELLVTFFTLFHYSKMLALFALLVAPIAGITSLLVGRKLKGLQIKVQESESAYRSFIQESLANLLVVKAFSNETYVTEKLVKLRNERFFWVFKKSKMGVVASTIMSLTFNLGYIVAFTVGATQIAEGMITYGTMSIFLTLVNRVQAPVYQLAQNVPQVVSILASAGRVMEVQEIPLEKYSEEIMPVQQVGIEVSHISFGYHEDPIFKDAGITIKPGEFVAIVGKSGIGKTTLIRLIMAFIDQQSGQIEFVNQNGEKQIANASTREYVAYVPQGNTLFSGSIRDNIRMGKNDATTGEIEEALKLSAGYDFVMELPEGLDTVIGEKGHGISEGQAQRIAIARALVKKAPFLVFDEATSSLDETTELKVLHNMQMLQPRPTCLLITHRRSVLQYCDRELRIDQKQMKEAEA